MSDLWRCGCSAGPSTWPVSSQRLVVARQPSAAGPRAGQRALDGADRPSRPISVRGLTDLVDAVADPPFAAPHRMKPDTYLVQLAVNSLGGRPERCLMVDDSTTYMASAQAARDLSMSSRDLSMGLRQ